ncbi:PREDICTED: E3 ubiquitin-protein ligase PUB23-like [Ipomoea nil]|uniref:E3 ubiquitin-protein ligase PUB23-like n=1 Tax=Ipomoea nil TaxID=35883 RepID=UPI0009014DC0|nr:PREDICTED: E3 ubiquitin-protein ligase PUB23-like [Ipomoea nil]
MENRNKNLQENQNPSSSMDFPLHFRCPISMEVMKDPVTISTGVTYERKNIQTWFHTYNKKTCPATMQSIERLEMTPNHTLKRLIHAWRQSAGGAAVGGAGSSSSKRDELVSLLSAVETTPFKVSCLKKLRTVLEVGDDDVKDDFKRLGGVEVVVTIMQQILVESSDFVAFRACEEAVGVLHKLPLMEESDSALTKRVLLTPELIKSMALMLQRGSAEARYSAIATFQKLSRADSDQWNAMVQEQGIEFFKSLLETISDDYASGKASSSAALQLLIDILDASKRSRLKATEAGGVCTLIDLLPDAAGSKCEKILYLIKLLCESADGRLAFAEHGLGIAAVSKKMLNVSTAATKIGVKILALICGCHPPERVLEEMLMYGAVKKLVALLHIGGASSTKDRAVKIFKMHGNTWKRYPCFPCDLKDYLGLGTNNTC